MVVVRVASFDFREYSVALSRHFVTSNYSHRKREGAIVRAHSATGDVGLGEIAPLRGFSDESLEHALRSGNELATRFIGVDVPESPDELATLITVACETGDCSPSAVFGIETAIADLAARQVGLPLCKWLDPNAVSAVPVNAVISSEPSDVEDRIKRLLDDGFASFKLKVAVESPDDDIARIESACRILPEIGSLRLDANGAWDFENALHVLGRVSSCPIEYIEEPLLRSEADKLSELHTQTGIPFAVDESVKDDELWETLIKLDCVTVVVIKPTIVGGLSKSRYLIDKAIQHGKTPVVTSTLESGVGVMACLHLAASLGDNLAPCGLDTLRYFSDSLINEPVHPVNGVIRIPDPSGLGVSLKE